MASETTGECAGENIHLPAEETVFRKMLSEKSGVAHYGVRLEGDLNPGIVIFRWTLKHGSKKDKNSGSQKKLNQYCDLMMFLADFLHLICIFAQAY